MTLIKSIHSELIKLKYPPILWLIGFVLLTTLAIVFSAHYIDIHKTVQLGRNPWTKIDRAGQAIFSIFMGIPFIVLLISAAVHIEHQNHGFKQLYTLPKNREVLILYKLSAFLLTFIMATLLLTVGNIIIGYILNSCYPEIGFDYHEWCLLSMLKSYTSIIVSLLGIIGIQFFLSLQFKGFLVPASVGVLAYVFGLILSSTNNSIALYFPYSYPIIARDRGVVNTSALDIDQLAVLNRVELSSLLVFVIFILLSLYMERRKDI